MIVLSLGYSFCVAAALLVGDILDFVVEICCCRAFSRRVGKGRVEGCRRVGGLILVCLVSVRCVFVPVLYVATLLFCFFAAFLIVEFVICWYFDS